APLAALRFDCLLADDREHTRRLLAAHHRDAGVRPHPQEARSIGAAAHAVIAGAIAAADDHGVFRHRRGRDSGHELGAVLGDAASLILLADHKAGDVLQEQEWDAALAREFDEMRALERALAEQDAVIGEDADRYPVNMGETTDQCLPIERL